MLKLTSADLPQLWRASILCVWIWFSHSLLGFHWCTSVLQDTCRICCVRTTAYFLAVWETGCVRIHRTWHKLQCVLDYPEHWRCGCCCTQPPYLLRSACHSPWIHVERISTVCESQQWMLVPIHVIGGDTEVYMLELSGFSSSTARSRLPVTSSWSTWYIPNASCTGYWNKNSLPLA